LTFRGVNDFLGEAPLCRKTAIVWNTFEKVYDLYWGSDNSNIKRRSGWNQKYRQALSKILDMLIEIDDNDSQESLSHRFSEKLTTSFEYHCPCVPATSPAKWIAPNGGSHDKATWLAFRKDGTQDGDAMSVDEYPEQDNSWTQIRISIKRDRMFGLSARDVVMPEIIEQLMAQRRIKRFHSYDDNWRDLISYQDDESARNSAAEISNAMEDRRCRIKQNKIETRKRILAFRALEGKRQLEIERKIAEEYREWNERYISFKQRDRERKEREERIRKEKNYRIIKRSHTPSRIFQLKYPTGRQSKHSCNEYDDDPLSYHNLRKAVKRGRWETDEE
jgi:hypothetical protein